MLHPAVLDRIAATTRRGRREPLESLARDGELRAYRHTGFWQPMDTLRDKNDAGGAVASRPRAVEDLED